MLLNQLKKEQEAMIIDIDSDKPLRDRLNSFGIVKGETVTLKRVSLAKQTIEIEVNSTLVVLRADEAEKIRVQTL